MVDLDPKIPNGVIYAPKPNDYVEGDGNLGALSYRILVPDGDWTPYVPKGELQRRGKNGLGFETNDCTAFSYTNVIETQFNYYRKKNLLTVGTLSWLQDNGYLDSDGELNISDRALGSMAGTTQNGNSLNKVADTARTQGLVPESKWPFGNATTYAEFYKPVPDDLKALAKEFLNHFELPYEQAVYDTISDAIKAAPMYVALVTCHPWNTQPVQWCGISGSNHAVELLKCNNYRIFDSYDPFIKDLAPNYVIPYFYKVYLNPKGQSGMQLVKDIKSQTVGIYTGGKDRRILALADIESLGLLGDEPQIPIDFTGIPVYNIIKKAADYATSGNFIVVKK